MTAEKLKAIVIMANRVAREFNDGAVDTCVLTSYALAAALTDLGYADAVRYGWRPQASPMTASSMLPSLARRVRAAQETVIGADI